MLRIYFLDTSLLRVRGHIEEITTCLSLPYVIVLIVWILVTLKALIS